jgi:hypothetical protein
MSILAAATTMTPQVTIALVVLIAMVLMTQSGAAKKMLTIRDEGGRRCASCRKHRRDCNCGR